MSVQSVIYWDTSAVMSTLFKDAHSDGAIAIARGGGTHLISSLAWAETHAVIAHIGRERKAANVLLDAARESLEMGPWRRANIAPDWAYVERLATTWPLRGADLWHLAAAASLRTDLPELTLLTFDTRLAAAAAGEGFAHAFIGM